MIKYIVCILAVVVASVSKAQSVPAPEENIANLVTFSKQAKKSFGDDDNVQTFFFSVPKNYTKPFYIRVYDPNIGGIEDEIINDANSKTRYSLFGGVGCVSEQDAREINPMGRFKSGNLIYTKTFGSESDYDGKWYTFGPINPSQGEFSEQYFGNVFKLICEGLDGDDGNLYKYFMSTSKDKNIPLPGGNAFTFEYTFRLHTDVDQVSHIYPFVDDQVVSIKQSNFDYDNEGSIMLNSVATIGKKMQISGDNEFVNSVYEVKAREKGTSLDIQFHRSNQKIKNNNIVFYVTNQYGQALPFYTVPIGGVPKYKGNIRVKPIDL